MTRVSVDELNNSKADTALNNLDDLSSALKTAGRLFDNFATYSSRRLKGEGYDAIRVVASLAAISFDKVATLDVNAHDNIMSGLDKFIAYMDGYSKLDDVNVNHLGDGLRYIGTQIGMLQSRIQKGEFEGDDLKSANNQLAYWHSKYDEILKEYEKLRDLAAMNSSTGVCIDNINTDVASLRTLLVDNWRS